MARRDSDDPAFLAEMAHLGVTPIDSARSKRQDKAKSDKATAERRTGAKAATKAEEPSGRAAIPRPSGALAHGTGIRDPRQESSFEATRDRELDELRAQLERAAAANARLEAERAAWHQERAELEARWIAERAGLEARWIAERAGLEARWSTQRNRQEQQRQELQKQLDQAEGSHVTLEQALMTRGCADENEAIVVLERLIDTRPRDFMRAVDMVASKAFAQLLEQRVAFVAEGVDLEEGADCVVVRVSPERCEVTGGSDIQAGFRRFMDACAAAKVGHITIVGGSPAYRRQLSHLTKSHSQGVTLNLVSGTQRRTRKRAEADMRASDVVVIWGATELDHSVSAVYTGSPNKLVRVVHRGISRMLVHVAYEIGRRR